MTKMHQGDRGEDPEQLMGQGTMQIAGLLIGGGVLGSLYLVISRNRSIVSRAVAASLIGAGLALLFRHRREAIEQSEEQIMAQLDQLDPLARAAVLKSVAEQQVGE